VRALEAPSDGSDWSSMGILAERLQEIGKWRTTVTFGNTRQRQDETQKRCAQGSRKPSMR